MFEKLQQASRLNDNGTFPYLRTHPMNTERIADMQARQQAGTRAAALPQPTGACHDGRPRPGPVRSRRRRAARLSRCGRAASSRSGRARRPASSMPRRWRAPSCATARRRGHGRSGCAALTAGDAPAARLARLLVAEIALAARRRRAAAALLDPQARIAPSCCCRRRRDRQRRPGADAAQRLQTGWRCIRATPRPGTLLADAYTAQGQSLRAIRAEAEARWRTWTTRPRWTASRRRRTWCARAGRAGDHIEASIIDTRARQVESLLREQALER